MIAHFEARRLPGKICQPKGPAKNRAGSGIGNSQRVAPAVVATDRHHYTIAFWHGSMRSLGIVAHYPAVFWLHSRAPIIAFWDSVLMQML